MAPRGDCNDGSHSPIWGLRFASQGRTAGASFDNRPRFLVTRFRGPNPSSDRAGPRVVKLHGETVGGAPAVAPGDGVDQSAAPLPGGLPIVGRRRLGLRFFLSRRTTRFSALFSGLTCPPASPSISTSPSRTMTSRREATTCLCTLPPSSR